MESTTSGKPVNYSDDEKMALIASINGVLFSKIKLVMRNALKNSKLAQNDHIMGVIEILAEHVVPQYCVQNMAKGDKLGLMHSLVYLLASKAQSVFTSGVVRTCIDQNWDLKGFKAVLLRILKEVGLNQDNDTLKLKEYFDKLIQSQNLQSQSCIKAISQFLKNPTRVIEEDDVKNPVVSFQSYYEFVKADVERYRSQNMKYECFQVLHPWAYDLDQVDFKYVINKDQTQAICKALKSQEARIFWLSFFKAQLSASADEFIGALREYCIMNHIKEHFDARYDSTYKLFMLRNNFSVSLAQNAADLETFIKEAHAEALRRYSGVSLLKGDQVRFPHGGSRGKTEYAKNEYISEEKLSRSFKITEEAFFDTMNIGSIKSWNWTADQLEIRLDMSRGTFSLPPNQKQESKLVLRFASVDTDELRDLEVKFSGDQAQFKVGEGDCNHYVIANDKKLWESQFMIISKDGRFYIRDLGVVHTSRLKVTPATALQLHQGALIDLGKVVHYHVNKLTHETHPQASSNDQFIIMRGTQGDYKEDDEAILRARPAWVSADENRDMVQNEILLEASSKQNKFSIGRSNRRDVELKLKAVSADHCKIEYSKEKGWYIHEQGKDRLSSNGTFVFMKSHQQMEDHEPSDLIPLFNGMIISFINYELQVRIEPKLTQELAQAKFENYGPLGSAPVNERKPVEVKAPAPAALSAQPPKKEEVKQQPHFEQTAVAQGVHAVKQDGNTKVAQTDKVSLAELKKHDQHSPAHSNDEHLPKEHQAQFPEKPKELIDQIWDTYDKDHSGMLSKGEMLSFVKEYLHKSGEDRLPEKQFNAMFAGLDVNHDDQISKAEMKAFVDKVKAAKVEEVQKAVAEAIHQEEVKELIDEIWAKYDQDHSGQLSNAEMKTFVKEYLDKLGEGGRLPEKQFNSLFTSIDDNHDGQINKAEMKAFIERVRATKVQDIQEAVAHEIKQTELIDEIWAAYDKDNSGQLSASEMRTFVVAYLTKVGEANRLPEKQFNALFNSIDINHDGQINKAEMKAFIDKVRATKVQDIQEAVAHEIKQTELIDEIWAAYDKDNSGQLSASEMRTFVVAYLTKVGEANRLPEKQFNALFNSIDINHDGQINKAEMKAFIDKIRATKVEDIQRAVGDEIHQEEVKELIDEIWAKYDKDNSGQLSKGEMRGFVVAYLTKINEADRLPEKQFNAIFGTIDENHDGQISKAEMKDFIEKIRAVQVQDIQEAIAQEVHKEEVKELIDEIWAEFDKDNSGQLSVSEMKGFVTVYLAKVGEADRLPEKQFNAMFTSLDVNRDGQINKEEMKAFIDKVRATKIADVQEAVAEIIHEEEKKELIDEIWAQYDKDNSGQLSKAEMKAFVKVYLDKLGEGDRLPEKQFNAMFALIDENNDGQISKAEMKEQIDKIRATEIADVQQAVADAIHQEEVKELIDQIWATYDKDNSGQLSKAEMKSFVLAYLTQVGEENRLPEKQFNSMFTQVDDNNDGQISKAEMKEFIDKIRATQVADIQEAVADIIHQEEVKELIDEIWVKYDADQSGLLSKAEMKAFVIAYLTKLGEENRLPKQQFNAMFASVDENGDGQISKAEMKDFIEKIRATEVADIQEALMGKDDVPDLNIPKEATIANILEEIWAKYDTDKNGTLNKSEAKVFVKEYLLKLGEADRLPPGQFNAIFKDMDEDGNGKITPAEMKVFIEKIRATEAIIDAAEQQEILDIIWEQFDKDNSGNMSRPEVRNFVKAYLIKVGEGERFPEEQFVGLFKELDDDGNNIITKKEMKDLIEKIRGQK